MGNSPIISSILQGDNCSSTKKFYLEDMINKDRVRPMFKKFAQETGRDHSEHIPLESVFEHLGFQMNDLQRELPREELLNDINELYTAGLCTPEYLEQQLLKPRLEKTFRGNELPIMNSEEYYRDQYCKFFLLHCYIKPFYAVDDKTEDNFLKKLAQNLSSEEKESLDSISLAFGLIFSFSVMRELKNTHPEVIEKSLSHMHATLMNLKPGIVRTLDENFFNEQEESINNQRDFLVSLVQDKGLPETSKELAIKIILLIGNMRASGEDYLIAFNLINEHNLTVNVSNEIEKVPEPSQNSSNERDNSDSQIIESEGSRTINILCDSNQTITDYDFTSLAFDDKYAYLYQANRGIFKIGMEESVTVREGLVYNHVNALLSVNYLSMVEWNGRLYIRQYDTSETVIFMMNTTSLEVDYEEIDDKRALAIQRSEQDDWNKPILENTSLEEFNKVLNNASPGAYRAALQSPLFTDGTYFYIIVVYVVKKDEDPDFSFHNQCEKYYVVEAYDPKTFEFVKSVRLYLEAEKDETLPDNDLKNIKIQDQNELIKSKFDRYELLSLSIATDGKSLVVAADKTVYTFSLETGKRQPCNPEIKLLNPSYNYKTSTFWGLQDYTQSPTLFSFKIKDFKTETSERGSKSSDLQKLRENRVKQVMIIMKNDTKTALKNDTLSLITGLVQSKDSYQEIRENSKTEKSGNKQAATFAIMNILDKYLEETEKTLEELEALEKNKSEEIFKLRLELFRSQF